MCLDQPVQSEQITIMRHDAATDSTEIRAYRHKLQMLGALATRWKNEAGAN
jgi:hypothetical protein